jgi:lysophospholipase L1-like esterase
VRLTAQQDHQRLLDLLHITSLRPGADGNNRQAPNAANYDESKANPYPNLPDPLVLKNGRKVKTPKAWWKKRRPEIVADFDREIYGRVPNRTPKVTWEVIGTTREMNGDAPVITKQFVGHVDNSSYPLITVDIQLRLTTPSNATGPVPVMLEFGFGFGGPRGPGRGAPAQPGDGGPDWQQQVLAKGWGYAIISPTSVQADNGAGLTQGIIGLVNKGQPRKLDDWGALGAWAWGASRALDYFETDKSVDPRQVGLEGHSRYGKATLVAMAYDQRFAIAFVSSSGEGGAKLHRRNWGEIVENVAGPGEYHWMAGNFVKYAGPLNWNDLPVDSHELIALCAPRPVFISAGANQGDAWVDAKGMFLAAAGAGPVYKLLGKKDLGTTEFPPIETPLIDGEVAYRQHSGGHTPAPNWPTFLTFAGRYIEGPPLASESRPSAVDQAGRWVGAWASAQQRADATNGPPAPGFADSTLRQIVHVSIGGKKMRVRFSNEYGDAALTIRSAHVAPAGAGGAIRPESDKALTFHGQPSVTIPPGAPMFSDPVDFDLAPLSDLAVTIRLQGAPNDVTTHPGARATSYLQAGDAVSAAELPTAARTNHWYFLSGVDVLARSSGAAVVALGDSITDGRGSTTDQNGRWPDALARRLQANETTADIGVLNAGIGGNRVLNDGLGPNALARLDRDVLSQSGVRWLIVLQGINDLGTRANARARTEHAATARELIGAYEQIVLRAHAHNIRVYGATILPCEGSSYFSPDLEADRQAVNNWIRTSGRLDGVIDFDAAARDPRKPSQLSAVADSGDRLHPADAGYRIMADAIDLKLFAK